MTDLIKKLMRRLGNHDNIELSRHEMFSLAQGIEDDYSAKKAVGDFLISYIENGNKHLLEQSNTTFNSLYLKLKNNELTDYELAQFIMMILEVVKNEKSFY
ncbi:hypothetical protein G7059_00130 [Erysipelothrix sp. HDW6A]|uniref:hypothetical protein n=1 Tax=Erysipelothrix sp. HDW6A TaxID=2714928 RepID=UPI0014081A7F|nr:hypothetical protein [Erysipelothrix sp. HDW6A]QIK56362.1 hypothetical protein G7059_00130 [Erysipelothrix sp. HDW6A]